MIVKALLLILLVMITLFVWRAGRRVPGLAAAGAVVAAFLAITLVRNPVLAAAGLAVLAALVFLPSRPRR